MRNLEKLKYGILTIAAAVAITSFAHIAHAGLMIMPVYAAFQDRERTTDITVLNTDDKNVTYRLSWLNQKQGTDGSYTISETPINPAMDFTKSVFFSPRQVSLQPNGKQNIRLSVRRPADLPDGEYHSHLKIQSIGSPETINAGNVPQDSIAMALAVNPGFAIPVIVRSGKYNATAKISDPQFIPAAQANEMPRLQFVINRAGTHGTMGKIDVYWTPTGGKEQVIGLLNNVNVFTEVDKRLVRLTLTQANIPNGTVRIVYEGVGPDKGITFDQKTFPVGN